MLELVRELKDLSWASFVNIYTGVGMGTGTGFDTGAGPGIRTGIVT